MSKRTFYILYIKVKVKYIIEYNLLLERDIFTIYIYIYYSIIDRYGDLKMFFTYPLTI